MKRSPWLLVAGLVGGMVVRGFSEEPVAPAALTPAPRVSVDEARRQAELLHEAMHATLQIVHHRYYREDEGLLLPAATMKEIFAEIETEKSVQLRWLAVEGQVMNTDHAAQTEFEHAAVKALQAGKKSHEETAAGQFRRAAPIALTNHCLKCHVPDRKNTNPRTAGLIITIPIEHPATKSFTPPVSPDGP